MSDHINDCMGADDLPFPDLNGEEPPDSPCTVDDFGIFSPAKVMIDSFHQAEKIICQFMESGGELYERHFVKLGRSFFVAIRYGKEKGYGETPYEAITMWMLENRH